MRVRRLGREKVPVSVLIVVSESEVVRSSDKLIETDDVFVAVALAVRETVKMAEEDAVSVFSLCDLDLEDVSSDESDDEIEPRSETDLDKVLTEFESEADVDHVRETVSERSVDAVLDFVGG